MATTCDAPAALRRLHRAEPHRPEAEDRGGLALCQRPRVDRVVAGPHHVAGEQRHVVGEAIRDLPERRGSRAARAAARPARPADRRGPCRGRRPAPRRTCGTPRAGRRSTSRRPCRRCRARGRRPRRGSRRRRRRPPPRRTRGRSRSPARSAPARGRCGGPSRRCRSPRRGRSRRRAASSSGSPTSSTWTSPGAWKVTARTAGAYGRPGADRLVLRGLAGFDERKGAMGIEKTRPVLITGCSTGIGRATAERLAERRLERLRHRPAPEAIDDLAKKGCKILALDVTDEDSMETRRRGGRRRTVRSARWSTTPATARAGRSRRSRWRASAGSSRPTSSA